MRFENLFYTDIMSKTMLHALVLIVTIAATFVFVKSPLVSYDLQIGAVLFVVLYFLKKFYLTAHIRSHLLESVIFTFIVVSIVLSSGGVTSSFFFLIYFLLFSLALFLEPIIATTTTVALILFFILSLPPEQGLKTLMPIFSLAIITPFAMYMGQEYLEAQSAKTKVEMVEKDARLFTALVVKNHIQNIKTAAENFMGDRELSEIKHQTARLEKLIAEFETEPTDSTQVPNNNHEKTT